MARTEGVARLFNGASMATSRAVLMTIGQLSFYDQVKYIMLHVIPGGIFSDNLVTHFIASSLAGGAATTMTQVCGEIPVCMAFSNDSFI